MNTKTRSKKPTQNVERFLWENEEEATEIELESMSYSVLSLAAGMIIVGITALVLIC